MFGVNHLNGFGVGAAESPFPTIASIYARYRADLGVTISTGVSQWDDQSGNARNLTQATGSKQPAQVSALFNGNTGLRFDGSNDEIGLTSLSLAQPFDTFIVLRQLSWTANDRIIYFRETGDPNDTEIKQVGSSPQLQMNAGGQVAIVSPTLNTAYLLHTSFNGSSSFQALNDAANVTGNAGANGLTAIDVGALWGGNFGNFEVAEIVIYSAAISGADLTALRAYFNSRYALW